MKVECASQQNLIEEVLFLAFLLTIISKGW